jgi:hypothetical protein
MRFTRRLCEFIGLPPLLLMPPQPREPREVHRLPPAPHFVGREAETEALRGLWRTGFRGVVALVGLGGAGKTAVAARFLEELRAGEGLPRPASLFVWSFYQEPDAGLFLQEAFRYFAGDDAKEASAKGTGLLHLLRESLAEGGPHLLVLDGLERVQRQGDEQPGSFGQIEDPLLKGLLTRVAEGSGNTTVLITSRFPLADLQPYRERGYRHLEVGGLGPEPARALLRLHGVKGDDAALGRLIESYGAHALTLDHLGGLLGQFLEGDPARAPSLPDATTGDRQVLRLARLLRAYEEHLPDAERALLSQLCLLRRSVNREQIEQLFLCSPAVHARTVRELCEWSAYGAQYDKLLSFDLQLDLLDAFRSTLEEALCAAPIAGPEKIFRQEVTATVERVVEVCSTRLDDYIQVPSLYAGKESDAPTDQLPLGTQDREVLRDLFARYLELREHPAVAYKEAPMHVKTVINFGLPVLSQKPSDVVPEDIELGLRRARQRIAYLTAKHFALRRVRELCRFYQKKWEVLGPLASLDAAGLTQVLDALVGRHLVLREAGDHFSVHPAVRDHFARLAAKDQAACHDLIREQLITLVQRPGVRRLEDPATLDLVEEALHHALQAGRVEEANDLYRHVLGGVRQLAWKLGEMTRGLRILRSFDPCPEPWDLAWFLRALGELDEAHSLNPLAYFRADIRLIQGRLAQVAAEGDSVRAATAAFLMGRTGSLPAPVLSCAVPRLQLLLYQGKFEHAHQSVHAERLYQGMGWEGDRARCQLLLAELARRQAHLGSCRKQLSAAAEWVLHSGSVEHLGLYHLTRARTERSGDNAEAARRAVSEGLHLAGQCGLGLYHVELLCEQAELGLAGGDPAAAEQSAREALRRAAAPDCQFQWGAVQAGHLLGQALARQSQTREARAILKETLAMRRHIGDPGADLTERLLGQLMD